MSGKGQDRFGSMLRVSVSLLAFLMPVIFSPSFIHDGFGIPKITVLRFLAPLAFLQILINLLVKWLVVR